MPVHYGLSLLLPLVLSCNLYAQLPVDRDSIPVIEGGKTLRMPWAGGINSAMVSNMDLNFDQIPDLVIFEKQNMYGVGYFRCFINNGSGTFTHNPHLSYNFPAVNNWALFRDYDNDGRADIFCSTNSGIKVYRNVSTALNTLKFELASELLHSDYFPEFSPPSISNLYAGSVGAPGIADVDNDSDLDILTYTPLGVFLELHRNMSQEMYGHSDSLIFQRDEDCWGNLAENNCTVDFDVCASRKDLINMANPQHAGSCVACLDSDGDLDQDLIMGDMNCNFVHYVHNTGTPAQANFTDTTRLYPNYPAKNNNGTAILINNFPCAHVVDVNADGRADLLASPNSVGTSNFESLWYYQNTSSTNTVNFVLQKKNFLQDEMIEVGQNSYPTLFDFDADGLKDLLIGTHGYFVNGIYSSRLTLYRNTGTSAAPVFSLITRDYAGAGINMLNHAIPAIGDIDGDGDEDICLGNSTGQIHWLENIAGAGNPAVFAALKINPFNFTTPSAVAAPQIFDLDEDGKNDLLIGMKNGRIAFYRNTGSGSQLTFSLVTSYLGNVDLKDNPVIYGLDGYAAPFFYRQNSQTYLLAGSVTGKIFHFSVPSHDAAFQLITERVNGYAEGAQSTVWFEDINNDNKRDLFIGNAAGGLSFFSSASPFVGLPKSSLAGNTIELYPNPVAEHLLIKASSAVQSVMIFDISGRELHRDLSGSMHIDVSGLQAGIYVAVIRTAVKGGSSEFRKKFVKQ